MIKQFELWSLGVSTKNYGPLPNLDNFLESTLEDLSVEDSRYFEKHGMHDMQRVSSAIMFFLFQINIGFDNRLKIISIE